MHDHRTALWRWRDHRDELLIGTALAATAATLVIVGPLLLLLAAGARKTGRGRRHPIGLAATFGLARAVLWLWQELRGDPHGRWHPCVQCGRPIVEPSRAAYCSHACRSYARLERDAESNDPRIADRAQRRLRAIRLRQLADENPDWDEVPF